MSATAKWESRPPRYWSSASFEIHTRSAGFAQQLCDLGAEKFRLKQACLGLSVNICVVGIVRLGNRMVGSVCLCSPMHVVQCRARRTFKKLRYRS